MGYTHYWTPKEVEQKTWNEFLKDAKKLYNALPDKSIISYNGDAKEKPLFRNDEIFFNGVEDKSHETFFIAPNESEWNFCKTAYKPYDLLVCAILILAHDRLGYEVSSDGDFEDWEDSIRFYIETIHGDEYEKDELLDKYFDILPSFLTEKV